jgi:hypothetical protein
MTTTERAGRPSVEHIVLASVLLVVLAVGGWFLLKPGAPAKVASPPAGALAGRPAAASGAYASPKAHPTLGKPSKPTKLGRVPLAPMTKAAYLKAGNKICTKMNAGTKALGDYPSDPRAQAAFVVKTFAITERALKQLLALPAPAAGATKLAGYYTEIGAMDSTGKALAAALTAGKTDAAKALAQKLASQSTKANAEFTAYGLTACGQP